MSENGARRGPRALRGRPSRRRSRRAATQADAWCEDGVDRSMRVYDGAVESLDRGRQRGAGVRVFREGRTGYAYGSDSERGGAALARATQPRRRPR